MKALSVMIKPAGGLCNMRCGYCFYRDEMAKRSDSGTAIMTEDTLRAVLEKVLAAQQCALAFQGGEPTLAGLDFFRTAVRLAAESPCRVSFALQTNGLLLDDEWCAFLAENHFLVGLSLDGPKALHDRYRTDTQGRGTYAGVRRALRLLQKHRVETNILSVITSDSCKQVKVCNAFFDENQLQFRQSIPCLDPLEEPRGAQPWSLTPEGYERYLKGAFDHWYSEQMRGRQAYHRWFENLLMLLNGQMPEACGMSGVCGLQYVVEADGSVYPCDFYALDEWRLGNFVTDGLEDIDRRRGELGFIEQSMHVPPECKACRWYPLCRNGCYRDRVEGKNYFCRAYQGFFAYAAPRLEEVYHKRIRSG